MSFIRRYKISLLLNTKLNDKDKKIVLLFQKIFSNIRVFNYKETFTYRTFDTQVFIDNRGIIMFEYYDNTFYMRHNYFEAFVCDKTEFFNIFIFMIGKYYDIEGVLLLRHLPDYEKFTFERWKNIQRKFKRDEQYFNR